jgi:hypothetical protein
MTTTAKDAAVSRLALSRERLRGALRADRSNPGPQDLLGRLVQRHPWALSLLALALGALVTRVKPWRWLIGQGLKSAIWAAVWPPLAAALASAPLSLWAQTLATLWRQHSKAGSPSPPPSPTTTPPPA